MNMSLNSEMPGGTAGQMPSSRYVLPNFEERTPYGYKRQDPYAKLFEDRIIFLGVQVDDASADDVMAQLLVLESQDSDSPITMYINSPGGSFTALTAIYDTDAVHQARDPDGVSWTGSLSRRCLFWPLARRAAALRSPTRARADPSASDGGHAGAGL